MATFLQDGSVVVFCDDGVYKILTLKGMIDEWERLWQTATIDDPEWGWEKLTV